MSYSKKVADKLIQKGWQVFDVNKDNANGADLTIARNGKSYRVEIKKACRSTRSWKTTPVGKSGIICDLIIIILPNNELLIQPMQEHLLLCADCGSRNMTLLVETNL